MTTHVCCRDCTFEDLVDDEDVGDVVWTHAQEAGHTVARGSVGGGSSELVTDGGEVDASASGGVTHE
ncbi:hypothetical protein [Halolamina sp.]|uniref:hypothetical protein n=1 Tax=Halolamina sp. TaxID=1940283 RepID=UPI0035621B89